MIMCASLRRPPFIICDALTLSITLSIRIWTEVRHYQNYPGQGTPNLQVIHGPSRKPSQIFGPISVCPASPILDMHAKKRACVCTPFNRSEPSDPKGREMHPHSRSSSLSVHIKAHDKLLHCLALLNMDTVKANKSVRDL